MLALRLHYAYVRAMQRIWTALILAGQRPGTDPLASHFGGEWKALVPLAGAPMLSHVIRTLRRTPEIARIVVIAQNVAVMRAAIEAGGSADLTIESGDSISASIADALQQSGLGFPFLVTTADHVLLTPGMVSDFLHGAQGADLSVAMVERTQLLAQYPDSKRTWLKFSDGHWSGANLFALTHPRIKAALELWSVAERDRKVPWKLFRHFGPWLLFRALTRSIGLAQALQLAGDRLGLSARLVCMDNPEAAIDVDKPADHELATQILAARSLASANDID